MIGKTISHYKILKKLGEGGMGVVYKAEDIKLERKVALKFLPLHLSNNDTDKKRFIHEAKAASSLEHNNICTIHEINETEDLPDVAGGQLFIVMSYLEGKTLREKIDAAPLKLDEAVDIAIQILEGLNVAHEKGIVHRDIKPANIMITNDGTVKIMDFGLAKLGGKTKLTQMGTTLGTFAYMSPEQTKGETVDQRTDIWSIGVVLYEMLTGQLPFKGDYEQAVVYSIVNEEPEPLTGLRTGVPMELERIVNKVLAKQSDERYQHADEIIADLKRISRESEPKSQILQSNLPLYKNFIKKNLILFTVLFIFFIGAFLLLRPLLFNEEVVAEPKPIAVIAFTNQTGDNSYDYLCEAIPNLLITSLEQSKYLRVMTWERMQDLLKQMGKTDISIINKDLSFELCQHDGVHAIVIGSFVKAGETFATDVKVLDVDTKELLKSTSTRGEGVQSILNTQIDQLSKDIASGVGLSKSKIESTPKQIKEVTTSSMDAYNFFLRGRDEYDKVYYEEAIRFLSDAIDLDSNFALAYFYLAKSYNQLLDNLQMVKAIEKAKVLSSRAPEKERLAIESLYASTIEKDPSKRILILKESVNKYPQEKRFHFELGINYQIRKMIPDAQKEFEKAIQLDPNFAPAVNSLAYIYAAEDLYDKAIETLQRYAALSPGDANPFDSMGELYLKMGNLKESIIKYREALRVQPSFFNSYPSLGYVYALNEDFSNGIKCLDSLLLKSPSIGLKAWTRGWKASFLYFVGGYQASENELKLIDKLIEKIENPTILSSYHWLKLINALRLNNVNTARKELETFFKFYSNDNPNSPFFNKAVKSYFLASIFLNENRLDSARIRFENVKANINNVESNKDLIFMQSGILESEILLAEGRPNAAIHIYRETPVSNLFLGFGWGVYFYNYPLLRDIVPKAFLYKGELDSAIVEYERLLTIDPKTKDRRLINPIYHYRLAKICEQVGKFEKAKAEYKKFLELWKDADEDLSELIDAKDRLTKLTKVN